MIELPTMPDRIARLPHDDRGYPVPWFICWLKDGKPCSPGEGQPDFRVIAPGKLASAVNRRRCWICGGSLFGSSRVFVIGPMCAVNRVTSEPPSHRECAEFAAKACPFLTNPREKRNAKNMIEGGVVAGIHIDRNPGAVCLYQTNKAKAFEAGEGVLFRLGAPIRIDWYARGRKATRAEIEESIESGYPLLEREAVKDGPEALALLAQMRDAAMQLLPAA
jgi:ferredoxin